MLCTDGNKARYSYRYYAMSKYTKWVLAALLLLCLLPMPYDFYLYVRGLTFFWFILLANNCDSVGQQGLVPVYIALALLFQPLFPFELGRLGWCIADIVVAIFLVISSFYEEPEY